MHAQTLDVYPDEMLIMAMLLGQFIDDQNIALREAKTPEDSEQARARLDIATRLRGKLPLVIEWNEALHVKAHL